MALAESPRARFAGIPDHALEHLDRDDRSLDRKGSAAAFSGGFLSDLIYGDEPRLIDDITPLVAADDPAREYLEGMRSLMAVPHYDQGEGLNMVVSMREEAGFVRSRMFSGVGLGEQPVRPGDA